MFSNSKKKLNSNQFLIANILIRGKPSCGDIDILITRKDGKPFNDFLLQLVHSLEGWLLTDHLAMPKPGQYGSEMYMGICCNGGLHRRIDIKVNVWVQFKIFYIK